MITSSNLPAIGGSTIVEDEEEKTPGNVFIPKRGYSQVSRRQLQITNRVK